MRSVMEHAYAAAIRCSHRVAPLGDGCSHSEGAGAAVLQLVDLPLPLRAVVHEFYLVCGELHHTMLPPSLFHTLTKLGHLLNVAS